LVSDIEPWFVGVQFTPVHGDCHLGNLLWAQGQPTFVDFDDFCLAPRVQDFWMLIGGRDDEAVLKLRALIKPYEVFCPFPYSELKLIEALRILRIVHYSAWIARRWDDPSFSKMFPEFGSERWWQDEVEALQKAQEELNTGFWGQIEPGAF
jgi:Ser/Thr protein kinase RdoA (MazF antagonist)